MCWEAAIHGNMHTCVVPQSDVPKKWTRRVRAQHAYGEMEYLIVWRYTMVSSSRLELVKWPLLASTFSNRNESTSLKACDSGNQIIRPSTNLWDQLQPMCGVLTLHQPHSSILFHHVKDDSKIPGAAILIVQNGLELLSSCLFLACVLSSDYPDRKKHKMSFIIFSPSKANGMNINDHCVLIFFALVR